jgi:hypothetical protein
MHRLTAERPGHFGERPGASALSRSSDDRLITPAFVCPEDEAARAIGHSSTQSTEMGFLGTPQVSRARSRAVSAALTLAAFVLLAVAAGELTAPVHPVHATLAIVAAVACWVVGEAVR